ncbi:MAG: hypothetical protein U0N23_01550 [Parasutterella excrementihominis]|nr:hypothetical protein [Parasutterella excrementihominis]
MLPDLEYFASLSGGKIFKGRLPILSEKGADQERSEVTEAKAKEEAKAKVTVKGTFFERVAKRSLLMS